MNVFARKVSRGVLLAIAGMGVSTLRAEIRGAEATAAVESLNSDDVHLLEANLQAQESLRTSQYLLSATSSLIDIDYRPSRYDILSQPAHRSEDRTAAELTVRFCTDSELMPFVTAGAYRGFTDFRSVWLDEYYRQIFTGVPGYSRVDPQGWHGLVGARWTYVPGSAILQVTVLHQGDIVSPGYEPQIGGVLLRGLDHLRTTAEHVSTENVLTPQLRSLVDFGATSTTGRDMRYSIQGSLNWSVSESLTLRTVVAGVRELPAFHAASLSLSLERDWDSRWFVGLSVRGYRDNGEVIDPLIVSSASPAMRSLDVALSFRWQGERSAFRLEGGPYRTRYDAVAPGSGQFARLYENRDWLRLQGTATWEF